VEIADVYDRLEAVEVIKRSLLDYRERFGDPETRISRFNKLVGLNNP
jgi:hypothetical protein